MNISLDPGIQAYLEAQVQAGRYNSIDDAVNSLLAVAKLEEELTPQDLEELRAEVEVGTADADRGDVGDWDPADLKRRVRDKVNSEKKAG